MSSTFRGGEARCFDEQGNEVPFPHTRRTISLPPDFPKIVVLCGSTRFVDAYVKAQREETLKGNIVISVGMFGHQEGMDMAGATKQMLDELHKRKIDLADEVLVLNVGKYVGDSTRNEIAYAKEQGKPIRYLEEPCPPG